MNPGRSSRFLHYIPQRVLFELRSRVAHGGDLAFAVARAGGAAGELGANEALGKGERKILGGIDDEGLVLGASWVTGVAPAATIKT